MSRMAAFDDWALFIFAMETFKLFGGDLMVTHVNFVLEKIMDLMKLYEKDGILMIKHGYQAKKPENLFYEPDSEVEFAHQITNSHECLYEFKESAEFIAFMDWDDVLLGSVENSFNTIFSEFSKLYPLAATFSIKAWDAFLDSPFKKTSPFNLEKVAETMTFVDKKLSNKLVV